MPSARICSGCSKPVARDADFCAACRSYYHPSCAMKKIPAGATRKTQGCCPGVLFERLKLRSPPPSTHSSPTSSRHTSPLRQAPAVMSGPMTSPLPETSTAPMADWPVPTAATLNDLFRLVNARFDDLSSRIGTLAAMQTQLDANSVRIVELEGQNRALSTILAELRVRLDAVGQAGLRHPVASARAPGVIISRAPCSSVEAIPVVFSQVAAAVGCAVNPTDIVDSRFLITRSKARKDTPLPIIVTLRSRDLSARLLAAKKAKGHVTTAVLTPPPEGQPTTVNVNEALLADTYKLLLAVKAAA